MLSTWFLSRHSTPASLPLLYLSSPLDSDTAFDTSWPLSLRSPEHASSRREDVCRLARTDPPIDVVGVQRCSQSIATCRCSFREGHCQRGASAQDQEPDNSGYTRRNCFSLFRLDHRARLSVTLIGERSTDARHSSLCLYGLQRVIERFMAALDSELLVKRAGLLQVASLLAFLLLTESELRSNNMCFDESTRRLFDWFMHKLDICDC